MLKPVSELMRRDSGRMDTLKSIRKVTDYSGSNDSFNLYQMEIKFETNK